MSARTAVAALLLICSAAAAGGCGAGGSKASSAGLRLQREDLVAVARALQSAQPEAAAETQAARAAWGHVANGLPKQLGAVPAGAIAQALTRAAALRLPGLFSESRARGLTGPGASLAGEYRSFVGLAAASWRQIGFAIGRIRSGTPQAAAFARANVALYIEGVYDAHFTLAQIGKQLTKGYAKLGGPGAFGHSLSATEVAALAGAFSEARYRLHPHVAVRLGS